MQSISHFYLISDDSSIVNVIILKKKILNLFIYFICKVFVAHTQLYNFINLFIYLFLFLFILFILLFIYFLFLQSLCCLFVIAKERIGVWRRSAHAREEQKHANAYDKHLCPSKESGQKVYCEQQISAQSNVTGVIPRRHIVTNPIRRLRCRTVWKNTNDKKK